MAKDISECVQDNMSGVDKPILCARTTPLYLEYQGTLTSLWIREAGSNPYQAGPCGCSQVRLPHRVCGFESYIHTRHRPEQVFGTRGGIQLPSTMEQQTTKHWSRQIMLYWAADRVIEPFEDGIHGRHEVSKLLAGPEY
jgi:hypothetical protein